MRSIDHELRNDLERSRSPQAVADLGVLKLFAGDPESAIALLEEAVAGAPLDAALLSDLAVAYLNRAVSRGDLGLRDLGAAFSRVDEALDQDPILPEARFNQALVLERLALVESAREAWAQLLAADLDPRWKAEAERRLGALGDRSEEDLWREGLKTLERAAAGRDAEAVRRIVRRFSGPALAEAEERLLAAWAEAEDAGRDGEAERSLWLAESIGEALAGQGEPWIRDTARAVAAAAAAAGEPSRLADLVAGHLAFRDGLRQLGADQPAPAAGSFSRAVRAFRRAGSPFEHLAELRLAICAYHGKDYEASMRALKDLERRAAVARYPALHARIGWMIGLLHARKGESQEALAAYGRAGKLFAAARQPDGQGAMHGWLAEEYRHLGEPRRSWEHRARALAQVPRILDADLRYSLLDEVANAFLADGQPRAAVRFRDEVVALARETGSPLGLAYAYSRRAETLHRSGHEERALRDVAASREACRGIPDPGERGDQEALLDLLEGELLSAGRPARPAAALPLLDRALDHFAKQERHFLLLRIHLARAGAFLGAARPAEARQELLRAVEEYEERRGNLREVDLRTALFAQARSAFEALIALAVEGGRTAEALELSERMRARELADRYQALGPAGGSPAEAGALAARLPPGVLVLEYAVLSDRLLCWAIRRGRVDLHVQPVRGEDVERAVRDASAVIGRGAQREREALAALHRLLLPPLGRIIAPEGLIVFVPDGPLHGVPFAALFDATTGRYLIEDHPVVQSPSAEVYLRARTRYAELAAEEAEGALVLGDPRFDRRLFPDLDELPGARAEAEAIGADLGAAGTEVLVGEEATEAAFREKAGRHPVVHVASHALPEPESPAASRLALAPGAGEDGALSARELGGLRYEKTRVVVLASCRSGRSTIDATEGPLSQGWHLLGAGVPAVVLSHWDVDDEAARGVLREFHLALAQGIGPADALRKAQVERIRSGGGPGRVSEWAGFLLLGG